MDKIEVIDSLKSSFKQKLDALEAVRVEGAEAIKDLNEARASGDDGRVSGASEKVERVGGAIKAAQAEVEDIQEQMGWFKEYQDVTEATSSDAERTAKMRDLFESMKSDVSPSAPKLSVGQHFANLLEHRGIKRWQDVKDLRADTQLTALLAQDSSVADVLKEKKSIKSIYSNHGTEFLDGNGVAVPGFMGYQCGLVEDAGLACLIVPPAEDFEECITQATLNGNRIRFTREVARVNNAGPVLETIYNPYPNFERDGTKPEGSFTLATVEIQDSKIAQFVVASDEVLQDCNSVAGLIDTFLVQTVNREKRRQLIAGTGTNGEMLGILNQPDLLTRTHQDVSDGGAASDNLYDTFRRGMTDLWFQAANTENLCVIMNPRDGEIADLLKDDNGRYLFNDSADCFNRQIRCLKTRYAIDVPAGTALIGDFSNNWVFYTRKAFDIRMGYTGDQFITNTNTILGEMRGLALVRCPQRLLKVNGIA